MVLKQLHRPPYLRQANSVPTIPKNVVFVPMEKKNPVSKTGLFYGWKIKKRPYLFYR